MTDVSKDDLFRALKAETEDAERLRAANAEMLAMLERWELFARDNQYTDEDCTFLAATRAAIAKAKGTAA